jgi:hypothetical protein
LWVFRVKRKSGITPERRRREDATIPDFIENQVQIFYVAMFCFINSKKKLIVRDIFWGI